MGDSTFVSRRVSRAQGVPRNRTRSAAVFDPEFLLTGHRYYLYSEDVAEISPAELCCHTPLIDDGSRHNSYCLLLFTHVDIDEDDLPERAAKYSLEDETDALLRYLEVRGESDDDRLPEWDECYELAAVYEVALPQS